MWFCQTILIANYGLKFNYLDKPPRKNKYEKGKNKFPGADRVIYSLAYMESLPENKDKVYSLCYTDRYLGLLEMPVKMFMEKAETTPLHRILIFKCNGEVIWDRKNRFTSIH